MMSPILIKAFGVCTTESKMFNNPHYIATEAFKRGFLIPEELCNEDMVRFIESETVNYNSTFYKEWQDITSRTRFELLIDQIFHYMSTYGTNFQGEPFIMNDGDLSEVPDFNTFKVIEIATPEEVTTRCMDMLTSGIAMSNDMVSSCVNYICDHASKDLVVDNIKNREAMIQICDKMGITPVTADGLIRWIVFKTTGSAMVVKDNRTINLIKMNAGKINLGTMSDETLNELSRVFFRYKPIILALKSNSWNKHYVNVIRRRAEKLHRPMHEGFWQGVLGEIHDIEEIHERLDDINNFKIVSLIQTIRERWNLHKNGGKNAYFIRNGKAWVENDFEDNRFKNNDYNKYLSSLEEILERELVKRLSKKAGVIKFPTGMTLACPTSEKKFSGNLPMGSYYQMTANNYFGIYWREIDGTRDFDLSLNDKNGYKIGWNSSYYNNRQSVVYSGDMTSANPEATEILYFRGASGVEGTIWINRYRGSDGSKYRYFIGQENIRDLHLGYMVDPNSIAHEEWMVSENAQEMIGVVYKNRIYPCKFGFGQSIVSRGLNNIDKFEMMTRKLESMVDLKDILLRAGFVEWNDQMTREVVTEDGTTTTEVVTPDYDLTNLDKDTLIKMFSE